MKRIGPLALLILVLAVGAAWWVFFAQPPAPPESIASWPDPPVAPPAESVPVASQASRSPQSASDKKVLSVSSGLIAPGKPGGVLSLVALERPRTFNPLLAESMSSSSVLSLLGAGLVELNPVSNQLEPALAAGWQWSQDHTQLVVQLRQGVKFSDGRPFTAADVLFTFNDLIYNPDIHTSYRSAFLVGGQPLLVEAQGAHTVRFTLSVPYQPILKALTIAILPKHLLQSHVSRLNIGVQNTIPTLRTLIDAQRTALELLDVDAVEAMDWAVNDLEDAAASQSESQAQTAIESIQAQQLHLSQNTPINFGVSVALNQIASTLAVLQRDLQRQNWLGVQSGTFREAWSVDTPAHQIAGLGPFKIAQHNTENQLRLARNPFYWKQDEQGTQLPYLDAIILQYVEDFEASKPTLVSGKSDALRVRAEDWPDWTTGLDAQANCEEAQERLVCVHPTHGYSLLRGPPLYDTVFVAFNQDVADPALRAVFRSKTFRQAIAHTINKESLVANVYGGLGAPQLGPVSPLSPVYDGAASVSYNYDLARAANMLDEIGLVDSNGDGVRNITNDFLRRAGVEAASLPVDQRNETFRELQFSFKTFTGFDAIDASSQVILQSWHQLGLNATFESVAFDTLLSDLFTGKFDATLMGFEVGLDPLDNANIWHSAGALHFWHPSASHSPFEWETRIDEILLALTTTFDSLRRQLLFSEFQRLLSEHLPLIFTVNNRFLYAFNSQLRNTEMFGPLLGGLPTVLAFSEILWWDNAP